MKHKPKRELGLFSALMSGLGGAIGVELFVLLNFATQLVGSAVVFTLFLCGLINLITMLSFCELGAVIPEVGGEYTYAKVAFGGFIAFLAGFLRLISSIFGAALAAIGFAYNFLYLIPLEIPLIIPLMAVLIIIIFTVLTIRGVKAVGTIIVFAILAILLVFVSSGFLYGIESRGVLPSTTYELPNIFAATAYTFLMFLGMRSIAACGAQIKDPGKNIPRAIILSVLILILLYCLIAYVAIGVVPIEEIAASATPLTLAAEKTMGEIGAKLLTMAGVVAALSSLSTAMMVQPSIICGLCRDGYLPNILSSTHKHFKTPYIAVAVSSIFTILFAATGIVNFVGYVAGFASILGFALVSLSLMKLRKDKPHLERPFKVPFYPYTPIIGIIMSVALLPFIEVGALVLGLEFIVLITVAYYLRMLGHLRIRVAFGGMSLGLGVLAIMLAYLVEIGFLSLPGMLTHYKTPVVYGFLFISVIYSLAGILNVTAKH